MLDVYSAGESPIAGADSRALCRSVRSRGKVDPILVTDQDALLEFLAPTLSGNDLVLLQGAGTVGRIARQLAENWEVPAELAKG